MFKIFVLQEEILIKMLMVDQVYNDENDKIWRISLLEGEKKKEFQCELTSGHI